MTTILKRKFTCSDIERRFYELSKQLQLETGHYVNSVALLSGIPLPIWQVFYGYYNHRGTYQTGKILFTEDEGSRVPVYLCSDMDLPKGCNSVAEEDEELQRLDELSTLPGVRWRIVGMEDWIEGGKIMYPSEENYEEQLLLYRQDEKGPIPCTICRRATEPYYVVHVFGGIRNRRVLCLEHAPYTLEVEPVG